MKSIAFFNNKGGVGKTTLTCNIVSYLNLKGMAKVLLVDADPQCNATQALLEDEFLEKIYLEDDNEYKTLYKYLFPLEMGEAKIDYSIEELTQSHTGYGTCMIPGHPKMSLVEDRLSRAWTEMQGGDVGGYRVTNWVSQLLEQVSDKYDIVVFDVGPSLGALNRTVLLNCDYIITPFGSDIFSLLGIRNISSWISSWEADYIQALKFVEQKHQGSTKQFPGTTDTATEFRFAGYSVQQYIMRRFKEGPRPVKAYDDIMKLIPETVSDALSKFIPDSVNKENLELGHIPFLYSLAPLAQSHRTPIHTLVEKRLVTGNQYKQVDEYNELMQSFCTKLLSNIGL